MSPNSFAAATIACPSATRLTANSLNSVVYACFGIFFISCSSKVTLILRPHGRRNSVESSLHVHHKVAISEDPSRALDPSNAVTLCKKCHQETENFGTKLIHKRRRQRGV
ncbi:hypothetical protein D3870_07315 [Noviherbaspirillum cavernae]|uniref:HNH domain-containing protein n=1 Tax=Noviherbaspirillum cavernae TaxID=2320862 RepID=A0A418X041_9BURK|nr:hypothetical protein D3870_07315 [Noviherbaspirillum cavernae]